MGLVQKLEQAMRDGIAIESMAKGMKGYFMGDPFTRHAYSYVPDIAKAVVALALEDDTHNQTWHLPTALAITGTKVMQMISDRLDGTYRWSIMTRKSMLLLGVYAHCE